MAQDNRISNFPQPMLEEIIRIVKETMVDETILARLASGDGYQKDPNIGSGGGTVDAASVLTASQAMTASQEAAMRTAIGAAPAMATVTVSAAGNFDLTEAAHNGRRVVAAVAGVVFTKTTTWSNDAIGCFADVDADGAFTIGAGITVPSGCASSSATAAGGAVDLACVDGILSSKTPALASGGYTDEQVRDVVAAMLAAGTHSGVTITNNDAGDSISFTATGGAGGVSVLAPNSKNVVPVSTTRGVLAQFDVPAGALGAGGELQLNYEIEKSGATDGPTYTAYFGAAGTTLAAAVSAGNEIVLIGPGVTTQAVGFLMGIRAYNGALRIAKNTGLGEQQTQTIGNVITLATDQAAGFTVWLCATTQATDSVTCTGAHAIATKVA